MKSRGANRGVQEGGIFPNGFHLARPRGVGDLGSRAREVVVSLGAIGGSEKKANSSFATFMPFEEFQEGFDHDTTAPRPLQKRPCAHPF